MNEILNFDNRVQNLRKDLTEMALAVQQNLHLIKKNRFLEQLRMLITRLQEVESWTCYHRWTNLARILSDQSLRQLLHNELFKKGLPFTFSDPPSMPSCGIKLRKTDEISNRKYVGISIVISKTYGDIVLCDPHDYRLEWLVSCGYRWLSYASANKIIEEIISKISNGMISFYNPLLSIETTTEDFGTKYKGKTSNKKRVRFVNLTSSRRN